MYFLNRSYVYIYVDDFLTFQVVHRYIHLNTYIKNKKLLSILVV